MDKHLQISISTKQQVDSLHLKDNPWEIMQVDSFFFTLLEWL